MDMDTEKEETSTSTIIARNRQLNRIGRALDVAADIAVWAEWVRREADAGP
jgi:hypothetical protein